MTSYPTHTWAYVVEFFRQLAEQNTAFAPMRGDVEQLAVSPFAAALYPVQSMHTLCLYQHDRAGPEDEQLRFEFEGGEFMVRYRAGSTPDPRFRLRPTAGVWTKRGSDPNGAPRSSVPSSPLVRRGSGARAKASTSRSCCITCVGTDERAEVARCARFY
jgi:hypothetical protein